MHLHEVEDGTQIQFSYTVPDTPYVYYPGLTTAYRPEVLRDGTLCIAETRELRNRFAGCPLNAETCRQISEWLQGVWAKRVDVALTTGTAQEETSELQPLLKWLSQPGRIVTLDTLVPGVTICFSGRNGDNSRVFSGKDLAEALGLMWEALK